MYTFTDVDGQSTNSLPPEAIKINDVYLENLVPGYTTLYTSGRESLGVELDTYSVGARDGESIKNRRFPARTIQVGFQLIAKSPAEFRLAFNKLNQVLNVQDAEISFNDELDKYYIGTPIMDAEVDPGRNAVVGEFRVFCADPFKYSVDEYEVNTVALPGDDTGTTVPTFVVNYDGAQKAFPRFVVNFGGRQTGGAYGKEGDCGYVALLHNNEAILLAGNENEEDVTSRTMFNQKFSSLWSTGYSKVLGQNFAIAGSLGTASISGETAARASAYGSGAAWHGPVMGYTITTRDASGNVGASDFKFSWKQRLAAASSGGSKQKGAFTVLLLDSSDNIIAGALIAKNNTTLKAQVSCYVGGNSPGYSSGDIDVSYYNKYFGYKKNKSTVTPTLSSTITKEGDTVTFNIAGITAKLTDPNIKTKRAVKIVFQFAQYGTAKALGTNALYSASLVDLTFDQENQFSAGDVLEIDTGSGELILNGLSTPALGALGNDWEQFCLEPGKENEIACVWSSWTASGYNPTFKMYYRKVYI